jgi:glucokinase
MTTILAGDIGGTKTILVLVQCSSPFVCGKPADYSIIHETQYPSQDFPDLVPMVLQFLREAEAKHQTPLQPARACFGIAGPVINNTSELTNLSWSLSSDRLEKQLNIPTVQLINDFAAIGYGVLALKEEDLCILQNAPADAHAPIAVIGAGTGLGEGFLIPSSDGSYRVFGSEGSHVDFAPRSSLEFQMVNYFKEKFRLGRVSVERVVSGQGIISIYQFLRNLDPNLESPTLKEMYETWEQEIGSDTKTVDLAAVISQAALTETDYLCGQTMRLFIENYGVEAGNLALKLLPYGGMYIAGGIASKNLPLMQKDCFIHAFCDKGRMTPLLQKIPVKIVLNPKVGLIGAALYATQTLLQ